MILVCSNWDSFVVQRDYHCEVAKGARAEAQGHC